MESIKDLIQHEEERPVDPKYYFKARKNLMRNLMNSIEYQTLVDYETEEIPEEEAEEIVLLEKFKDAVLELAAFYRRESR